MSAKSIALIAAAVLVVCLALYLFVQVRGAPAQAGSPQREHVGETTSPSTMPQSATTRETVARTTPPPAAPDSRVHLGNGVTTPQAMAGSDDPRATMKVESLMELANKAYDRQDYDDASNIAGKVLAKDPTNVRMLRIMVSSNCIQGDVAVAQQYYNQLPKFDREQMKTRCDRYGVTFKEPSQ